MNTQYLTQESSNATKPHSFLCRRNSLSLTEKELNVTSVFNFEKEPSYLVNQESGLFENELDSFIEQRANTTLGNLLEVPNFKFGDSIQKLVLEENSDEKIAEPLGDNCFSIQCVEEEQDHLSFDSEGEKSEPSVKERTMALETRKVFKKRHSEFSLEGFNFGQ